MPYVEINTHITIYTHSHGQSLRVPELLSIPRPWIIMISSAFLFFIILLLHARTHPPAILADSDLGSLSPCGEGYNIINELTPELNYRMRCFVISRISKNGKM